MSDHPAEAATRENGGEQWYLGTLNDGLFIINKPPRPSSEDAWHNRPDGPTLVICVSGLDVARAQSIVTAHNAALSTHQQQGDNGELVKRLRERTVRELPKDWQKGRKCPECGVGADRPKCMWEHGAACPRHDPDSYSPSPWITKPDPLCAEAADALSRAARAARGEV